MSSLSSSQLVLLAHNAGLDWSQAAIAAAIAKAESGGNAGAHNGNPPDDSYGLWQINLYGDLFRDRCTNKGWCPNTLIDPTTNAQAMYAISGGGHSWTPWSTYTNGAYQSFLSDTQSAAAALSGESAAQLAAAGAGIRATEAGGQGGTSDPNACQHSIPNPFNLGLTGICLDKPLAILEMVGGAVIMLIGVALLVAVFLRQPASQAVRAVAPVGKVARAVKRTAGARQMARNRAESAQAALERSQAAEARAQRLETIGRFRAGLISRQTAQRRLGEPLRATGKAPRRTAFSSGHPGVYRKGRSTVSVQQPRLSSQANARLARQPALESEIPF